MSASNPLGAILVIDSNDLPADLHTNPEIKPAFDRFYFNLHGSSRHDPFFVLGVGVYPQAGLIDGYVCVVPGGQALQRNLRFSTTFDERDPRRIGPLTWSIISNRPEIRLLLGSNSSGIEVDVTWSARAPLYIIDQYRLEDAEGSSAFDHLFQSGSYNGSITIDGKRTAIDSWLGQRDRSRGSRRTRDRLGMHLWIQAQLEDACVGFLFNEDRQGRPSHCDGAVMWTDGRVDRILSVRHALKFSDEFELLAGTFDVQLEGGVSRQLQVRSTGPGIFMEAAGYNGWHGVPHGRDHFEHDNWPLDGTFTPRNLDLGLTDALCEFEFHGRRGMGISEYALTRSQTYKYRPTLA